MKNCSTTLLLTFCVLFYQFVFAQPERGVGNIKAEQKTALIIGNTNYDASVGRLKNLVNDVRDVAAFQRLGFKDHRLENFQLILLTLTK